MSPSIGLIIYDETPDLHRRLNAFRRLATAMLDALDGISEYEMDGLTIAQPGVNQVKNNGQEGVDLFIEGAAVPVLVLAAQGIGPARDL